MLYEVITAAAIVPGGAVVVPDPGMVAESAEGDEAGADVAGIGGDIGDGLADGVATMGQAGLGVETLRRGPGHGGAGVFGERIEFAVHQPGKEVGMVGKTEAFDPGIIAAAEGGRTEDGPAGRGGQGVEVGAEVLRQPDPLRTPGRITSYNVCYTKLLRSLSSFNFLLCFCFSS